MSYTRTLQGKLAIGLAPLIWLGLDLLVGGGKIWPALPNGSTFPSPRHPLFDSMVEQKPFVRVVHPKPDVAKGVEYWEGVPATVNGVLGGFGNGPLPRVDAMGSRLFLLKHLKRLGNIPPASANNKEWMNQRIESRGGKETTYDRAVTCGLDCGAGVGRVTEMVLLPLLDEVHMVEPVGKFLRQARTKSDHWKPLTQSPETSPFHARKAVHFHEATLQGFDPAHPYAPPLPKVGGKRKSAADDTEVVPPAILPVLSAEKEGLKPNSANAVAAGPEPTEVGQAHEAGRLSNTVGYDVVWIQWCLQHLSDAEMVAFLTRCKAALKPDRGNSQVSGGASEGVPASAMETAAAQDLIGGRIFIKENVCGEAEDGSEHTIWDSEDYSITRSTQVFERVFREAGLELIEVQVQQGFPDELFQVKMWALR